ncbi:uncharacterized protein LOC127587422 [Pristis pectinata]|uniref:uncharacterized protein LOC127587422 n=1 Tax=Pristis pectinata TaxID=685728 RepID=UPI00223CAA8A|nr:uncharacterized protein LOC127587422 [Pristis pectinata]
MGAEIVNYQCCLGAEGTPEPSGQTVHKQHKLLADIPVLYLDRIRCPDPGWLTWSNRGADTIVGPQDVYTQTPSAQVLSVGSTFKVHCHTGWLSSGKVFWYKRQHREHLQYLFSVMEYTPPVGRLSGQVNGELTIYSLIVNDVQRNDSGWYYCSAKEFSGLPFVFGNGSKLIIAGSPHILLLTPAAGEIRGVKTVQLMCLAQTAAADSLSIRWEISGRDVEGRVDSGTIDRDGTRSVRSQIDVPVETWSSGAVCTCALRVNDTETISDSVFAGRDDSPQQVCISLLYLVFPVVIILPATVMVAVRRRFRNRRSGTESTYASLTFNVGPTETRQSEARIPAVQ